MLEGFLLTPEMLPFITAAIVQALKGFKAFKDVKDMTPLISMGVGVGLAYALAMSNPIAAGLMIGLMASGGYDALKIPGKVGKIK